jgi:putative ABC transport system substrate-binding protein
MLHKKFGMVFVIVACAVGAFLFFRDQGPRKPVIAIVQIASHPALDAARDGFMEAVRAGLGDEFAFVVKNADGSVVNAQAIAQSVTARSEVKAFFALGTPAAQALVQKEQERPIFFTAVTYPEKSGLKQKNVAGISDFFALDQLVDFSTEVVPQARTVGILFNPGSEVTRAEMHEIVSACDVQKQLTIPIAGVTEAEIIGALKSNIRKIDVCLAPTDNTISSVMPALAEICRQARVPLIVADKTLVVSGPLAGIGMDYYALGWQAGLAAVRVLLDEVSPEQIGILFGKPETAFNVDVCKELLAYGCELNCPAK